ncbi:MAG: bifunctional diaminohydroxyphosphoribosylaminopyrimidine deaminase/5-amino-6-(5-phosphoribosylamino)uracil reductase RibD [Acidimicrobiales bacterium]
MSAVETDETAMATAIALGDEVRTTTSPNPWVGCVVVAPGTGRAFYGATQPPGGAHAEVVALGAAGAAARGATAYVTLEPCAHHGRTPPCADALAEAGVARVVVGVLDPDRKVAGRGVARLRGAGIEVSVGTCSVQVELSLAPYLKHRRTGRPWVVLKLATTLDGRIAAPDGDSAWITGPDARADAHRLRAESDAVLVGAGTVRQDDPRLTVRDVPGRDPLRVVLGTADATARVQPALSLHGEPGAVLDELGRRDVLQLLVEGGARVAHLFHTAGLVDHYVLYVAPALFGGDDGLACFAGPGAPTMADLWRGSFVAVDQLGADLRVVLAPARVLSHVDTTTR